MLEGGGLPPSRPMIQPNSSGPHQPKPCQILGRVCHADHDASVGQASASVGLLRIVLASRPRWPWDQGHFHNLLFVTVYFPTHTQTS